MIALFHSNILEASIFINSEEWIRELCITYSETEFINRYFIGSVILQGHRDWTPNSLHQIPRVDPSQLSLCKVTYPSFVSLVQYKPYSITQSLIHTFEHKSLWFNNHLDPFRSFNIHCIHRIRTPNVSHTPCDHLHHLPAFENH